MSVRVDSPVPSPRYHPLRIRGPSSSVRRCLFFADDSAAVDVNPWLKEELQKVQKESERKWNFAFSDERPCDGALQWCEVPAATVPAPYRPAECLPARLSPVRPEISPSPVEPSPVMTSPEVQARLQPSCEGHEAEDCDSSVLAKIETTPPSLTSEVPATSGTSCSRKSLKRGRELTDYFPVKKQCL